MLATLLEKNRGLMDEVFFSFLIYHRTCLIYKNIEHLGPNKTDHIGGNAAG